jgi:hypothetical protein
MLALMVPAVLHAVLSSNVTNPHSDWQGLALNFVR